MTHALLQNYSRFRFDRDGRVLTVTIAGRTYRIACAEGEEQHLDGLAASYNARVEEMRATFGQVDDLSRAFATMRARSCSMRRCRSARAVRASASLMTSSSQRRRVTVRHRAGESADAEQTSVLRVGCEPGPSAAVASSPAGCSAFSTR